MRLTGAFLFRNTIKHTNRKCAWLRMIQGHEREAARFRGAWRQWCCVVPVAPGVGGGRGGGMADRRWRRVCDRIDGASAGRPAWAEQRVKTRLFEGCVARRCRPTRMCADTTFPPEKSAGHMTKHSLPGAGQNYRLRHLVLWAIGSQCLWCVAISVARKNKLSLSAGSSRFNVAAYAGRPPPVYG